MTKLYKGKEISYFDISAMKNIASNRYCREIYEMYYNNIYSLQGLAKRFDCLPEDLRLVIGLDWFILYEVTDYYVGLLDWVAINDSDRKMKQSIDMLHTLKEIIRENHKKEFSTCMRHDTSYQIYLKMLEKHYIKETFHSISIDAAEPNDLTEEDCEEIVKQFSGNENLYDPEFLKFVLHNINFSIDENFPIIRKRRFYITH